MKRIEQTHSAVLPPASMASHSPGKCGTCDRQAGRQAGSEGCGKEERSGRERDGGGGVGGGGEKCDWLWS